MFSTISTVRTSSWILDFFKLCYPSVQRTRLKVVAILVLLSFPTSTLVSLIGSLIINFVSESYIFLLHSEGIEVLTVPSVLPKDDEEALTAILNLGHFFQYDTAQEDARAALEKLPSFGPVARYTLGLRNGIKDWVVTGFTALVSLPFSRLSLSEVRRMGEDPTFSVNDTRFQIDTHRRAIAYHVPAISEAPTCSFHLQCEVGWDREWKIKVTRHLLHPDGATSGREIRSLLDSVEINDVHPACKDITIQSLRDNKVFTHEEEIIERVLSTLVPRA